jgi:hypothetical protein
MACRNLKQDDAKGIQVGTGISHLASKNFGWHISDCSCDRFSRRFTGFLVRARQRHSLRSHLPRNSEIEEISNGGRLYPDIFPLDLAMHPHG